MFWFDSDSNILQIYKRRESMLKSFAVQILHDSYLGATAALDLGVAHPSVLVWREMSLLNEFDWNSSVPT